MQVFHVICASIVQDLQKRIYCYDELMLGPNFNVFTLPYRVWSSIVIVHEKSDFFASFFRNISKTAETILIEKIGRNNGIAVYKKALISEHRKNFIFRDNNCFVKMSVSLCVTNFCGRASSKTSVNIETKFHM